MNLCALELDDAVIALDWRAGMAGGLRTTEEVDKVSQEKWFMNLRQSEYARYWAVDSHPELVGIVGITRIEWENGTAEMSIMAPGDENLKDLVRLVVRHAFESMRLHSVSKEVYESDSWREIYKIIFTGMNAHEAILRHRKYFHGKYYDSVVYTIINPESPELNSRGFIG